MQTPYIQPEEKRYLRELAKKQAEYAALPENREKEQLWYRHNALQGERPLIVMEEASFEQEILPQCVCQSPLARQMEREMQRQIVNHELVRDDKVTASVLDIGMSVSRRLFDMDYHMIHPKEEKDNLQQGFQFVHPIEDLEEDFQKLKPSVFSYDEQGDRERRAAAEEAVGDILPIVQKNHALEWNGAMTNTAVTLMGLENLLMNLAAEPELTEQLLDFIATDLERYVEWMEEKNLLTPNNGNDYAGSGSYGFSHELQPGERVRAKDLWFNMNSQESSSISPRMYGEQVFPIFKRLAARFGLIYYGCCEPVHTVWKDYLSTLPNLRKLSISAWCDEDIMGEALRESGVIYSRKPSPLFIGTGDPLDENAFRAYVKKTLTAARGCRIEFIFRDVYTLGGDITKPGRAVEIIRSLIG